MSYKAHPVRDPFAFSLGGVAAVNSFAIAPVVADDRVNAALADRALVNRPGERLERDLENQPDTIREIENFLGRYFAGGLLRAA